MIITREKFARLERLQRLGEQLNQVNDTLIELFCADLYLDAQDIDAFGEAVDVLTNQEPLPQTLERLGVRVAGAARPA